MAFVSELIKWLHFIWLSFGRHPLHAPNIVVKTSCFDPTDHLEARDIDWEWKCIIKNVCCLSEWSEYRIWMSVFQWWDQIFYLKSTYKKLTKQRFDVGESSSLYSISYNLPLPVILMDDALDKVNLFFVSYSFFITV